MVCIVFKRQLSYVFQKVDSSSDTSTSAAGDLERAHSDSDLTGIKRDDLLETRREST